MDFEKGYYYNKKGINIYDSNDKCFNSFCCSIPYEGKMLNLEERRNIIYKKITFCEENCYFKSINFKDKKIECSCIINPSSKDYLKIQEYNNNRHKFNLEIDDNISTHKKVLKCINLFNKWNIKSNIGFWVCFCFIIIQIVSIILFIVDIRKLFSNISRKIYSNPPKSQKKKNYFEDNNKEINNEQNDIDNNDGNNNEDINIYGDKKYFEQGLSKLNLNDKSDVMLNNDMMNQKYRKFSKINNNNNLSRDTSINDFPNRNNITDDYSGKLILLNHKKGKFSILNPIKNVKYDIDNYNLNDRFIYEYNSIPREIFKVFCEKAPLIRSFFIKYIYEISGMNICCYCFCFLFTLLIQSLLINEKIIQNMRSGINKNKYLLSNSFISFIIYISSFRIISIFFNTSFRIGGFIYELSGEKENNNSFKIKINCFIFKYVILFLISLGLSIFFWIYITIFYSLLIVYQKIFFKYFLLIFLISLIFSIFITLLIVILRNISLLIKSRYLYNCALIIKRLFDYFIPF